MMSKSETGVMNNASNIQTMHLGYGPDPTSIFKPNNGNGIGISGGGGGSLKKKRGRPRKYGPDGSMPVTPPPPGFTITQSPPVPPLQQQPTPPSQQQQQQQPSPPPSQQQLHSAHQVPASGPAPGPVPGSSQPQPKKARGRPPGASNKKQHLQTLGLPGIGFTPHVIIVKAGEDMSSKIMSFSQNGPRAICILSANGALSNVTLRQSATSGRSVTYEGRFEILSLSGSFMHSDKGGHHSRSGGLSISLAVPDGRVIGGGVAGLLIAASPVQVVVASFIADDGREVKSGNEMEAMKVEGGRGVSCPTSGGNVSESSGSPKKQGAGGVNSNMHGLPWM